MAKKSNRSYSELKKLETFEERYAYLRLNGKVGRASFGFDRYLNQVLYNSPKWRAVRDVVILRDNGCDLGVKTYEINDTIFVHHMNALTIEDIEQNHDSIFDPEFLICTSMRTHQAVHYSDESLLPKPPVERQKNDTSPWLK